MVGARSAAMAFNRVLDADIDARNPRTKSRHIPAGLLSARFAWGFIAAPSAVFLLAAAMLNRSLPAAGAGGAGVVFFYSWTKRFTSLSHVVLGFALGIAPAAAWIAIARFARPAHPLAHRRGDALDGRLRHHLLLPGLRVRPPRRPVQPSAHARHRAARCWFAAVSPGMLVCLVALVSASAWVDRRGPASPPWRPAAWEHSLVHADDLSRVDAAFFTVNGWVSVIFFVLLGRRHFLP